MLRGDAESGVQVAVEAGCVGAMRDLQFDSESPRLVAKSFHTLSFSAPVGRLENFLSANISGEILLWEPADAEVGEPPWTIAGRGITARVDAKGSQRFRLLRERAALLFRSVAELNGLKGIEAPAPRLFGGVSFAAPVTELPWTEFGEASFTLPRWTYGERNGTAFLRLCVSGAEMLERRKLDREIAIVRKAIDAETEPRSAALERTSTEVEQIPAQQWRSQVDAALKAIRSGTFTKVVLSRRSHVRLAHDLTISALRARLARNESGCLRFAFQRGDALFVGATPERLVDLTDGQASSFALGGSLPRLGNDAEEGARLLASAKDRREHQAVIDGICGSLAPFCRSVAAAVVPSVRTLGTIHHLQTLVTGRLRAPSHVLELVAALHPTPAVCGLPQAAALSWITEHEPARGWYAAPIGWFDATGGGSFAVGIRSALVRGRDAWVFAGCGIVEGSDADLEYAESAAKQLAMLQALGVAE